jgi:hypothetical protein
MTAIFAVAFGASPTPRKEPKLRFASINWRGAFWPLILSRSLGGVTSNYFEVHSNALSGSFKESDTSGVEAIDFFQEFQASCPHLGRPDDGAVEVHRHGSCSSRQSGSRDSDAFLANRHALVLTWGHSEPGLRLLRSKLRHTRRVYPVSVKL